MTRQTSSPASPPIAAAHTAAPRQHARPVPWRLRPALPADLPALAALYVHCARSLGPRCFTPAQVAAWASFAADAAGFADYVLLADTWVAMPAAIAPGLDATQGHPANAAPLGFSGVDAGGEVKSLYVHPDTMRCGLASQLLALGLARAQALGIQSFAAWVTPFSLPVFQRAGFALVERVQAEFAGVMFERIRVVRCGRGKAP